MKRFPDPNKTLWFVCFASAIVFACCIGSVSHAEDANPPPQEAARGSIVLQVTGFESDEGQACASLYASADGYPREPEKATHRECSEIRNKRASITFENIAHGTYAAFAFHDGDSNNSVKTSRIGIPREPVGASNNAKGRFGPPSFADASFQHNGDPTLVPFAVRGI